MHEPHVRQVTGVPPAPDVGEERRQDILLLGQPFLEEQPDVRIDRRPFHAGPLGELPGRAAETAHERMHAEHDVAPVAGDVEIFDVRPEAERVHRQMRLDEPPAVLGLQPGEHYVLGEHHEFEPGRELADGHVLAVVDELGDDLLDPRRAGLPPAGDDDVLGAPGEVVPARRVHHVVLELGGLLGPQLCGFGHHRH